MCIKLQHSTMVLCIHGQCPVVQGSLDAPIVDHVSRIVGVKVASHRMNTLSLQEGDHFLNQSGRGTLTITEAGTLIHIKPETIHINEIQKIFDLYM